MLWQDCPYVAFSDLKSEEAQARLSVCQPISGLQEVTRVGGVERYAHQSGEALHVLSSIAASIARTCACIRKHIFLARMCVMCAHAVASEQRERILL